MGIGSLARSLDARTHVVGEFFPRDLIASHNAQAIDIVRLASEFGVRTPEDAVPSIVSDVPVEAFRALDVDAALNDVADSASVTEARTGIAEEASDELRQLVAQIDPGWVAMLDGARQALDGSNPDRLRHALTSLRELFTKALHAVAPTSEVEKWSSDPADFSNSRPTRRARLLYLYGVPPLSWTPQ